LEDESSGEEICLCGKKKDLGEVYERLAIGINS
jgi:hypothetical protein